MATPTHDIHWIQLPHAPVLSRTTWYRLVHLEEESAEGRLLSRIRITSSNAVTPLSVDQSGILYRWVGELESVEAPEHLQHVLQEVSSRLGAIPMDYRTDAYGKPVTLTNLAEIQAGLEVAFAEVDKWADDRARVRGVPAEAIEGLRFLVTALTAPFRDMSIEQANELLLEAPLMLGVFGGATLNVGGAMSVPVEVDSAMAGANLAADLAAFVEEYDPAQHRATVAVHGRYDQEALRLVRQGLDKVWGRAKLPAEVLAGMPLTDSWSLVLDARAVIDVTTGQRLQVERTKTLTTPRTTSLERMSITAFDPREGIAIQ